MVANPAARGRIVPSAESLELMPRIVRRRPTSQVAPTDAPDGGATGCECAAHAPSLRHRRRLGELDFVFESAFPASDTSYRVGLTTPSGSSPRNSASSSRAPFMMPSSA